MVVVKGWFVSLCPLWVRDPLSSGLGVGGVSHFVHITVESELGKVWGEQQQDQALHLVHTSVAWRFHPNSRLSGDLENTAEMEKGRNRVSPLILLSWQQCVVGKKIKEEEEVMNGRINNNISPPSPSLLPLPLPSIQETDNKQGHLIHSAWGVNKDLQ